MIKAVITGDIIHSTNLTARHRQMLLANVERTLKTLNKTFEMRSEIFRGDSFQCVLKPVEALRAALVIKTHIRSLNPSILYDVQKRSNPVKKKEVLYTNLIFDARIVVGVGEVDAVAHKLASSHGEAFTLSGHLLDDIKNTKQTFAVISDDMFDAELETESVLLDAIISKTSALQCQVLKLKLLDRSETEIAKTLNVGQSAINQRSTSGNWNAIAAMVERFEEIYDHD